MTDSNAHQIEVAEASFDKLAAALIDDPAITQGSGFNDAGLRVGGKMFARTLSGQLLVKLPGDRCTALVEGGTAEYFDVDLRVLREWVAVDHKRRASWLGLAREARAFVGPDAA